MIHVTKTFLPPREEYSEILKESWGNAWLTNRGALVKKLETNIQDRLKTVSLLALTNGTLPLQIALKILAKQGEVITTPFSYVATTSSIVWENCTPVFVDIHPEYLTLDETKIEAAITKNTTAILATHVFGNPCAIEEIEKIAKKHQLKVIYDAAHCFGVNYNGQSLFNYGDVSTCSFHATKLFHTGEGGAIFCKKEKLMKEVFSHHNFGHITPEKFSKAGINAKMSELQAAMGLAVFPYLDVILEKRKAIANYYLNNLSGVSFLKIRKNTSWNYAYFPIVFESEHQLLQKLEEFNLHDINPRRYFYPSLNTLPYVKYKEMPVSEKISKRVLCLPLYPDLPKDVQQEVVKIINS